MQEEPHIVDHLRRGLGHRDGPGDGSVEGVAVRPNDQGGEVENPRSVKEGVVVGGVFEATAHCG